MREMTGVFACYRSLRELEGTRFARVPVALRHGLRDLGLCHYMAVFRSASGDAVQLDFGPRGGDCALAPPGAGPSGPPAGRPQPAASSGDIREEKLLRELPASSMYVGRSRMTIEDVRAFNSTRNNMYALNRNDCRHYVDELVEYTTGIESASAFLMRHHVQQRLNGRSKAPGHLAMVVQRALERDSTELLEKVTRLSLTATAAWAVGFGMPRGTIAASDKLLPTAVATCTAPLLGSLLQGPHLKNVKAHMGNIWKYQTPAITSPTFTLLQASDHLLYKSTELGPATGTEEQWPDWRSLSRTRLHTVVSRAWQQAQMQCKHSNLQILTDPRNKDINQIGLPLHSDDYGQRAFHCLPLALQA
eukprot:SM000334S12541  [mRNA]  locus=s334:5165:7069:- [translate_table: standard]